MRVIVAHEKHDTRLLAASTEEELAASSLALLRERWDSGHWYFEPEPNEPPYTQGQIDAMPADSQARRMAVRELEEWKSDERDRGNRHQWWEAVKALLAMPEDEALLRRSQMWTGRLGKGPDGEWLSPYEKFPSAWVALHFRRDAEYEGVRLQEVEEAPKPKRRRRAKAA